MTDDSGAPASGTGSCPTGQAPSGLDASRGDPSRQDDPYWDYEENDCGNCGGEGYTYGCSWDWQCDTYDEGEGTCLCTRPCDWCSPRKADAALQAVLAEALSRDRDASLAEDAKRLSPEGVAARAVTDGIARSSPEATPHAE